MRLLVLGFVLAAALPSAGLAQTTSPGEKHFDPKGAPPSTFTIELRKGVYATLPFEDQRDFEEAKRGFIAEPPYKKIMADAGNVAWDMGSYQWLLQGKDFESIHPSLQRQAVLNMAYGLYEVVPEKVYQVRGFDLANITFIKGDTGWIVFDPLTAKETARAALELVNEKLGKRPVLGVVYSHSHVDHFGGVRGVIDEADAASGKVKVIAPEGFMQAAIEENVFSGNAMSRRTQYSYAVLLPRDPNGHADQSIGKNVANGNVGLIAPNVLIKKDFEDITVDGVQMVFQNTPDTEAPVEMNTWFPQFKGFWAAENITGTIHNIYTPRGAPVRNALNWSKQINTALYKFGQSADVMFASHSWPRWGNARIQEVMRTQRDTYANLNNQTLHFANQGVTINEIQNVYKLPPSLWKQWAAHSYHGSEMHNSRGVINRFLGYWDGNPTNIAPLSPRDSAPLYVEMMGGSDKILAKGKELNDAGKYREAMEILNKLVFAQPSNQAAKDLLAISFEQLGYQMESPTLRNIYLQGAYELRNGLPTGPAVRSSAPDVIRAMSTENWLDFIGISIDPKKAEGIRFTINLFTPDNGEKYIIEMSNATLTNIKGEQAEKPDLTVTVNRADLNQVMMGAATFDDLVKAHKATFSGDRKPFDQLRGLIVAFRPNFEIMPGTAAKAASAPAEKPADPFTLPDMAPPDSAGD
ncbi:alkyl sulfatase BDS1-like metallo-beta-lactamase superfamily hydrolase [Rhodoblastus acidophilus]|uniref:alkyl/aryl-sulfatase n=1 Tax=Rhodoblastus acidophilus TaxID=1074 RepID=UPI002223F600|nr:alkyl sulfatase dimerization domain-containing protein [Rhodoblastus acidophilus]MCW2283761.1 alkyl sulfatase BDS1-like metallo-beta-lactamase superfamily hydrolase [Rhodoblastus acidophilus]MCW2332890.1 alkyl sulfatase BDS1-like metallo-beta-lactamase superfamily hydrolase [Rhodoblastus acidophilus]